MSALLTIFAFMLELCKKHGKGSFRWVLFFLLVCLSLTGFMLTTGVDLIGKEVHAQTGSYSIKVIENSTQIKSFYGRIHRMERRMNKRFDKQDQILMEILTK